MNIYIYRRVLSIALLFVILLFALPTPVHADGGAPNLAYIAGGDKGISVIDVAQQKVDHNLTTTEAPQMILLSADGRFLYVTQPQQNRVTILAARTGESVCSASIPGQPSILAIDNSANRLYAAGSGSSTISQIDPTNCAIKHTIQAPGPVYGMAIAIVGSSLSGTSGNQLWVTSTTSLTIFDDLNGDTITTINIPDGPQYVSIPPGATVYVTTRTGNVLALDLQSRKAVTLITKGGPYGRMDYDESTGEVYIPDRQHHSLLVLSPVNAGYKAPHEPNRSISLATQPVSIAITNDGQLGFAALADGNVVMLDIPGRQTITTIPVGGNPTFVITGVYPPVLGNTPAQASTLTTVANIAAYVFIVALFVVPIILFRRYARARPAGNTTDPEQPSNGRIPEEDIK